MIQVPGRGTVDTMSLRHHYLRIDEFVLTHERKVSVHTQRRPKLQLHEFFPYHRHLKFSALSRDTCGRLWSMYRLRAARCIVLLGEPAYEPI